jgi:hypothetical protein
MSLKFLFTGPRDMYATPALDKLLFATKSIRGETVIVHWNNKHDTSTKGHHEYHFTHRKNFINLIKWQWFLYRKMVKHKPNVVVNMSILSFLPIVVYGLTNRIKIIYDCRDYLAVSYNFNIFFATTIKLFDNIATHFSSLIIVPDSYGYKYFNLCKKNKIHVIHNTVRDTNVKKKYNKGKIKLAYLGYLSQDRNIDQIFKFIEQNPNIELHIACNYISEKLQHTIPNLENIIFHGRLKHKDAQKLLSGMDYCLLMYDSNLGSYQYIQPTKFYDCLLIGLPYICSKGMINLEKHVNNETENISWKYGMSMNNLPLKNTSFCEYGRNIYNEKYDYEKILDEYKDIMEVVCKKT